MVDELCVRDERINYFTGSHVQLDHACGSIIAASPVLSIILKRENIDAADQYPCFGAALHQISSKTARSTMI
jgi:hypothetical protein